MAALNLIGPVGFFDLSPHPSRPTRQQIVERFSGLDGVSVWDTGEAGDPFTIRGRRATLTYEAARTFYRSCVDLESLGALPVMINNVIEPQILYKVLRATPVDIRSNVVAFVGGDPTPYYGWAEVSLQLLPIRVTVQQSED